MDRLSALVNHALSHHEPGTRMARLLHSLVGIVLVCAASGVAFLLHFNLSTAGSIQLFLVLLVAFRWGFLEATVASVTAVVCLNFFFTPPIFRFTVADPQNLVSLATFEATALLVSGLSSKVRVNAAQAELQRLRATKLYELSRAILLIDGHVSIVDQLSTLIREFIKVDVVDIWVIHGYMSGSVLAGSSSESAIDTDAAAGDYDDLALRVTRRVLRLGTAPVGTMTLRGWDNDSLVADAVASLAAIAIERARAVQRENRAEAERNIEQLRTAVLDGLAHGIKTPLTAIQTASSGLIAIDQMNATQAELVSIINDQATVLSQLTTRLLKTAALEAKQIRLRRSRVSMLTLVQNVIDEQAAEERQRMSVSAPDGLVADEVDAEMIELAVLQLLDNAAKYSDVDRPIEITIVQAEFELAVIVASGGSSIRPEDRERIFERFYRGVDATHAPTGTGLGLSIVKKTAEAHGGRAWVECVEDTTRFYFTVQRYRSSTNG